MKIAIDPGASTPGAAAWGTDRIEGVIVWTWAPRSATVTVRDALTGEQRIRATSVAHAGEWAIASCLGPQAPEVAIEGLYQPRGAYARRRSAIGSVLVLAEHVGALAACLRPVSLMRPGALEWRPRVGIPARTEARRAGGLAIEIAERRLGLRFVGSAASQEAAAEASLIWLSTWGMG